jgi:hypothetical protein
MSTATRRAFLAGAGGAGAAAIAGAAAAAPAGARRVPLLSTYVAGSDRYDGPSAVAAIAPGDWLRLRREPENGYDRRAVSVWTDDGRMLLGYVPRIHNQAVANLMDAGLVPEARAGRVRGPSTRPEIGVEVFLALPA